MAVPSTMDLGSWLVKHLESEDGDLLRQMIKAFAEALMSAEAQARCNAGYGEVSPERTNSRNGYRADPGGGPVLRRGGVDAPGG